MNDGEELRGMTALITGARKSTGTETALVGSRGMFSLIHYDTGRQEACQVLKRSTPQPGIVRLCNWTSATAKASITLFNGFGMAPRRFVQAVDELIVTVHSGFEKNTPGPAVHEPVVGAAPELVRPNGVGNADADGHAELAGTVPRCVKARLSAWDPLGPLGSGGMGGLRIGGLALRLV